MSVLSQLKEYTTVVADTGDFHTIENYKPVDATTNPSLIYKASGKEEYRPLVAKSIQDGQKDGLDHIIDLLFIEFGSAILEIIPGRVSTEVDARLSFDTAGTIARAKKLIGMYAARGIPRERILIKIATTWEGIRAAEVLEKQGIHCNLTLLFSSIQAAACAEAGVQLISPFVGRILDWHKKDRGVDHIPAAEDPGVLSVTEIFHYYKSRGVKTEIMGASFRNKEEIMELAGCDLLTISPDLLEELRNADVPLPRRLNSNESSSGPKIPTDEKSFRWFLNENAMATEKLADGIRRFTADLIKLEDTIRKGMGS